MKMIVTFIVMSMLLCAGCGRELTRAETIAGAKECTDGGMDYRVLKNGLDNVRNVICVPKQKVN